MNENQSEKKPAVDWTKPIQTRNGEMAEFMGVIHLPIPSKNFNHLIAYSKCGGEGVFFKLVNKDGRLGQFHDYDEDIINVPERIKRTVWLNVYAHPDDDSYGYSTRERADANEHKGNRIACVKLEIDCEVGEGWK